MIWKRYFIFELMKTFFLFLLVFFGLYILIDYASHTTSFHIHSGPSLWQLAIYYGADFSRRMDVLVPFALLVATVRTLCQFNVHNELVAMMASGVSLRRLMRPFVLTGLFFVGLIYLNNQFLQPIGLQAISAMGKQYSKKRQKIPTANHFLMPDGTTVLFFEYNELAKEFSDVYWIKSADEIFRMEWLDNSEENPVGHEVDVIARNPQGHLILVEHQTTRPFPPIDEKQLFSTVTPAEELSLTALWQQMGSAHSKNSEKESYLITVFYKKLAMPWLCLLAVIGPMPFCLRFTRTLPLFLIYAFSIFGLVALYLVMDAATVLGKRQALWPAVAIWTPLTLFLLFFGWRFRTRLEQA